VSITLDPNRPGLPPAELIDCAPIRRAAEAHAKAQAARQAADRDVIELRQTRQRAVASDRDAYADALTKGKGDPGTPATEAHDAKLADAERRRDALAEVERRSFHALQSACDEHGDAWREAVEAAREAARAECMEAIETAAAKLAQLDRARVLMQFTSGSRRRFVDTTDRPASVPSPRSVRDVSVDVALAALRQHAAPPAVQPSVTYLGGMKASGEHSAADLTVAAERAAV